MSDRNLTGSAGRAVTTEELGSSSAWTRLHWVLLAFIVYGAFEGLLKRLTGYASFVYPIKDAFFIVVLAHWMIPRRVSGTSRHPPYALLLSFYLCIVAIEALNPRLPTVFMWFAGLRTSYMYALFYFVAYQAFRTENDLLRLGGVVGVLAVVTSVGAMVESSLGLTWVYSHGLEVFINAAYLGASGRWIIRPSSIGNGPGSAAMMEYIGALGLLALALRETRRSRRVLYLAGAAVALGGVVLGGNRIVWLQTALATLVLILVASRRRLLGVALVVVPACIGVGLSLLFSGGEIAGRFRTVEAPLDTYLAERYPALKTLPDVIETFPLGAGLGWNTPRRDLTAPDYVNQNIQFTGIHNYLSNLALEVGVPGLGAFLFFSLGISLYGLSVLMRTRRSSYQALLGGYYAVFVSLLLSFLAGGALFGWPGEYYWIFAGVIARSGRFDPGLHSSEPSTV